MTSSMTSQSDLKAVSLYSFLNEKNSIFHDNWRTNKDIIFKLSVHMYHWIVNMRWQTILDCYVDDVIGSENKSKLWTAIALSIFELEHRSKAQNVTNAMAIFVAYSNSSFTSGKNVKIKHSFNLTSKMKRWSQIVREKLFSWWWRHQLRHTVTSKSSIYSIINKK